MNCALNALVDHLLAAGKPLGCGTTARRTPPPAGHPTPYDGYEIEPCTRHEEPDKPGCYFFEPCEPHEADVWTLYGHIPGAGVEAIGDFSTREAAEEVYARITGGCYRQPTSPQPNRSHP
jgi:hypothetical protein